MKTYMTLAATSRAARNLAVAGALIWGATACSNFLSGGELSNNPNVANGATAENLIIGTQVALWNELGGDPSRTGSIWAQHLTGALQQYADEDDYGYSEQTTNGFHQGLYIQGGLIDLRTEESKSRTAGDSLFLGIAQVQEAWLMGQGADLFGDLVYSQALTGVANPPLDKQMVVYAHVIALLDTAIANMAATSGSNVGPGSADLAYGGDPVKWTHLAHTLKARFYMHQLHAPGVLPDTLSARAYAETQLGLQEGEDYSAQFSGNVLQQNYWYNFNVTSGRSGYYIPSRTLIDTLIARGDSGTTTKSLVQRYFNTDNKGHHTNLSDSLLAPNAPQTFASYVENLLLGAEAAYRSGNQGTARTLLLAARTEVNSTDVSVVPASGLPLLRAILVEKWITDFTLGTEAWTDYRRTCTPNNAPTGAQNGGKVPMRLYYDSGERQTDTNIPDAGMGINGDANQAQPRLATSDGDGTVCHAQQGD